MSIPPQPFKIAHISDLHLTRYDNDQRSEPTIFGQLTGMNKRFRALVQSRPLQSADMILVSGDITDRGHIEAWNFFWTVLKKSSLIERTWVVPGNHDVCCLSVRMPGKQKAYAAQDLKKAAKGLSISSHHPKTLPWRCSPDPRVAIFGLNSNNLGNWNIVENAIGSIGYYQLSKLARLLRDSQEPVKIIVLHHSPNIPSSGVESRRKLKRTSPLARKGHQIPADQRQALRLLCIGTGVRLIVHGHLHRAEDRRLDGLRVVGVPSSTEPRKTSSKAGKCELATYTIRGPQNRVYLNWQYVKL